MQNPEFLILAQAAGAANPMLNLVFIGLMVLIFWFIVLRPQAREAKAHRDFVSGLKAGDEVISAGGLYGKVVSIDGAIAHVELSRGTKVRFDRNKLHPIAGGAIVSESVDAEKAKKDAGKTKKDD
ncbi:preprotein translocase subunit YajC [Lujinxingia sediminis]|uniref:Preprotein translocase subunit YajC n=1 Tax=Lujinxingia sediminis TaxID=2480984 RepID=A0ABY0CY35_9DELT|nr:preprotein translocase subunit YajC [Lujinxingia sediminis]RVU48796.1 preprotein translocase subunit YajC [Lujinxingia sediminis]